MHIFVQYYGIGKIGSITLKDPQNRKIPLKDVSNVKYH